MSATTDKGEEHEATSAKLLEWQRMPTVFLQRLITGSHPNVGRYESTVIRSAENLDTLRGILDRRITDQRAYRDALKRHCLTYGTEWYNNFVPPDSENEKYEQWLDHGDLELPVPSSRRKIATWTLLQPQESDFTSKLDSTFSRIYAIESVDTSNCGALIATDISLQVICELGTHLGIDCSFFAEHLCSPYSWSTSPRPKASLKAPIFEDEKWFQIDSVLFEPRDYRRCIALEPQFAPWGATPDPTKGIRISCLRVNEAFFLVMLRNATHAEPREPPEEALVLPMQGSCRKVFDVLYYFFLDEWNARRLSLLMIHGDSPRQCSQLLTWQLMVSHYHRILSSTLGRVENLIEDVDTDAALGLTKAYRGSVARLRRNLLKSWVALDHRSIQSVYDVVTNQTDPNNAKPGANDSTFRSERQLASLSFNDEYEWLEKQMIHLMSSLNQNLQLIIASISLKQSRTALEDSRTSRRNGERATLLTLLAAVYLPLTLATGVFGMNIREISGDATGPSWRAVSAMAGTLLGISVIFIIIFWLYPRRKHCNDPEDRAEAQWEREVEAPIIFSDPFELHTFGTQAEVKQKRRRWQIPKLKQFKVKSKKNKRS
ncbi:hypothetical protein CKM354_000248400 [Cercospora kikuchii]|uniref:Uncharacterized protein n=1 Tax=Cercospora kikuchii TaxID=84275 RepID=A0A9P3F9P1_9PEZI|nr:uncharacterized protein CKM354_000248400 [Cercospora kikuchii]GIZ39093.1 hypothetical protein CKM354_000248400 [Cercospora kikuchii]